ncbi:hypothetical protein C172_04743 [Paenibacillus sp. FSL H8-457]|nr:hypothetical protein C172_04743 [Paenibacillus sp. FSL H8-457]
MINIQRILLREIMGCNGEGGIIVEKRSVHLCRQISTTKIQISGNLRATEIGGIIRMRSVALAISLKNLFRRSTS